MVSKEQLSNVKKEQPPSPCPSSAPVTSPQPPLSTCLQSAKHVECLHKIAARLFDALVEDGGWTGTGRQTEARSPTVLHKIVQRRIIRK